MNSKNLLTPRPKSPYKLDPNSDRYRVCPNDGVPFMANHRSTIFCNEKCADEYHNLKKKEKIENTLMNEVKEALNADVPASKPVQEKSEVVENIIPPPVQTIDPYKKNIEILNKYKFDPIYGTNVHLEWLWEIGIDLDAISGKGKLYNIDGSFNCHFVQIGYYRLYRNDFSHFLIVKTK